MAAADGRAATAVDPPDGGSNVADTPEPNAAPPADEWFEVGSTAQPVHPHSPAARLSSEPFAFGFFQAVRLLGRLQSERSTVGHSASPHREIVRFRAQQSLSFPPSEIHDIAADADPSEPHVMTVSFFGLTGPSGTLPRHYTELLMRLRKESRFSEKDALRDWLDLFNHRLISLFYRAWEKYRFAIAYEREEYAAQTPDSFTQCLLSLVGLGTPSARSRLRITLRPDKPDADLTRSPAKVLAEVDDQSILYYAGLFSHRPRSAAGLEAILNDYFQAPIRVRQFQGQWLKFEPSNQCRLGTEVGNSRLGQDAVIGERVWDVQGKIRVCVGPLSYEQFQEFLPDRAPTAQRKAFFLLVHLVRLYIGPELDFDVQLCLRSNDVPKSAVAGNRLAGSRLGWNSWLTSLPRRVDAEDAVFEAKEVYWVDPERKSQRWQT